MSNYNPNYRPPNDRGETAPSPEYSRENSFENIDHRDLQSDRGLSPPPTTQAGAPKPANLSVNPASTSTSAYTPYYAGASPTAGKQPGPPSPKLGDTSAYKAYRPPVLQTYSTESIIPAQPHGPYTAYQPPKPVTTTYTSQVPSVPPKLPSPVISPLILPLDSTSNNRPISPPTAHLPSPLAGHAAPPPQKPLSYAPPSVTDSIASTPTEYEAPLPPIASGPFTPQGTVYQQDPQKQVPQYHPPKPVGSSKPPPPPGQLPQTIAPVTAAPAPIPQTGPLFGQRPPAPAYPDPNLQQPYSPPSAVSTTSTSYVPEAPKTSVPPLQHASYAVELPTSPGSPNAPAKPTKQLSFTLPPSDIYAERIANYMNMLEKEASLQPTGPPTLGQPEPEDLETRRNRVFGDWIISEAKLRGPKFATELADDLDSLSFGNKRGSGQFGSGVKPRGANPPGGTPTAQYPYGPDSYQQAPPARGTKVDVSKFLPLLYPPPPPKLSAAAKLEPFQKNFTTSSNLAFIEKNRASFVAHQSQIDRAMEAEIDETRRRRGKRNAQDAENVIREIRKREGITSYERFDRDVVNTTYGELMKTGEVVETIKQGVEDFVKDNSSTLTTSELLEIFTFLTAVQDFSTTVHNHTESLLTERSMKYMYSLTVPLYEANDAAEAKKIEAWNQSVVAGQVADNKQGEEKRVAKYSKFVIETCDQAIAREKAKTAQLSAALTEIVRAVDNGIRDGGRIDVLIPQSEDIRPFDLSDEGKLLWLRSRILAAAIAIQGSIDAQKTLQKTKDVASRLAIKARYAALEAEAIKQHPTNQQKNIEDINKLREQQAREIDELNRSEELDSEQRGMERGRFEATVKPASDALKAKALAIGGEKANNWIKESREESLLGWIR